MPASVGVKRAIWLGTMIALTGVFVGSATANLDNYPPLSADEIWIMSASYKLATQGIFGSDLYAGFYNADQHYFIALPVYHLLQALNFRIGGVGVAQARSVSLLSAVGTIWIVGWLTHRWYGLLASLLAGTLLVLWRSDLFGVFPGLPLLTVARSGRYDVNGVMWVWLSIGLLDLALRQPRPSTALALGVCAGLAALTQFFGVFVLPLTAGLWVWQRGRRAIAESTPYWMLAGFLIAVLPYVAYVAQYPADFVGQAAGLKAERVQFGSPNFYLSNLLHEPDRFAGSVQRPAPVLIGPEAFDRPLSPWLLMVGIWPALIAVWTRVKRSGALGDRVVWLSLLLFEGLLALLDQTKAPLYAIVLLPSACVASAALGADAWRWIWIGRRMLPLRLVTGGLLIGLLMIVLVEGTRAYRADQRQAVQVSDYLDVGQEIDTHLTSNAVALGSERWWWALHRRPYLALDSLWTQWRVAGQVSAYAPEFAAWIARTQAGFIVVSDNVRGDLLQQPAALQAQFSDFLATCTLPIADWVDTTYGEIEIYQVEKTPIDSSACRP